MPILEFPDPRQTGSEGIVAVGGDLHPDSLRLAYRQGIFPWPISGVPVMVWFCPPERAILDFTRLHIPRRLERMRRNTRLTFTIDRAFDDVIEGCRTTPRPGQESTWITPAMLRAYRRFHRTGDAHSVEAWDGETLVGGIYGVDAGGVFAGESMFYREPNASRLCLLHLIAHLSARGLDWLDIQMLTPHMEALGATAIPRVDFLRRLRETQARNLALFERTRSQ